jgi:aspartate oxidase
MPHQADHDVIIIGAGFAGLYMLYRIPGKQGATKTDDRSVQSEESYAHPGAGIPTPPLDAALFV